MASASLAIAEGTPDTPRSSSCTVVARRATRGGGTATRVAQRGWQALTLDARGHGDSAWSEVGDYRLETLAEDVRLALARLDDPPVLVGASLGGLTSISLTGELAPGVARSVVLVDIVPDMEEAGAQRIGAFMNERARLGFVDRRGRRSRRGLQPSSPKAERLDWTPKEPAGAGWSISSVRNPAWGGEDGSGPDEVFDVDRLNAAASRMVADMPVMLVRGRVSDLVSEDKAAQFCVRFPTVEFVDVSDAGHWSPVTETMPSLPLLWSSLNATAYPWREQPSSEGAAALALPILNGLGIPVRCPICGWYLR